MSIDTIVNSITNINNTNKLGKRHGKYLLAKREQLFNELLNEVGAGVRAENKYSTSPLDNL